MVTNREEKISALLLKSFDFWLIYICIHRYTYVSNIHMYTYIFQMYTIGFKYVYIYASHTPTHISMFIKYLSSTYFKSGNVLGIMKAKGDKNIPQCVLS